VQLDLHFRHRSHFLFDGSPSSRTPADSSSIPSSIEGVRFPGIVPSSNNHSAEHHWIAWRDVMAQEGHPVTVGAFTSSFGHRNDTILRGLLGQDLPDEEVERIGGAKEALYRRFVKERGVEPLPGALRWIERLRKEGWRQAIASSAPAANIEAALKAIGTTALFEALVSADEVGAGKPDPAVFLAAAARLGVPPGRCVVVEDAPAGLEGARRAGMRSVGVLSAHHPELVADVVVATLEDLPATAFDDLVGEART
jgi:HAD superfamily hydrolase (TIGR01509 family)